MEKSPIDKIELESYELNQIDYGMLMRAMALASDSLGKSSIPEDEKKPLFKRYDEIFAKLKHQFRKAKHPQTEG